MITPDPKPETGAAPTSETCVPADAFDLNGEAPEPGREVEFTGKARVSRVEGGHVYLETTHVNGKPVAAPASGGGEMTEEDLMRVAEAADAGR